MLKMCSLRRIGNCLCDSFGGTGQEDCSAVAPPPRERSNFTARPSWRSRFSHCSVSSGCATGELVRADGGGIGVWST